MTAQSDWRETLEHHRVQKDRYFTDHPDSPIPPDQRASFSGLNYYPPDPDYRFVVELREHEVKERVTVATTTEGEREYLVWGEFAFELDGAERTLEAYRRDADDPSVWVPFRDATSGEETYGAGRYLDLDADEDRTDEGWVLDFNYAYNPFCAYSDRYECPLVPMENWLDVAIEAGERAYDSEAAYDP